MARRRLKPVLTFLLPLVAALLTLPTPRATAHPGDFAAQVWVQTTIADGYVEQEIMVPLEIALTDLFDGLTLAEFRALDEAAARQRIAEYHDTTNPIQIDGLPTPPEVVEQHAATFGTTTPEQALEPDEFRKHAQLRYVVQYPTDGVPGRVDLVWGLYMVDGASYLDASEALGLAGQPTEDRPRQPIVMTLDALAMSKLVVLSQSEPAYTWHGAASAPPAALLAARPVAVDTAPKQKRPFPVFSVIALLLGGLLAGLVWLKREPYYAMVAVIAGLGGALACYPFNPTDQIELPASIERPTDAEAVELFTALHRNLYRAFDYNTDTAIYDALAQSVAGPELAEVYNRVYASLILEEEGGAVGKVQNVDVLEAEVVGVSEDARAVYRGLAIPFDEDALFAVRAGWTVQGIVSHFGHTHERLNAFEATYTLAPVGGAWRIIDTELHRQERLDDPAAETDDNGEPLPLLDNLLGEDDAEGGAP